jgi:hypothetical protein
MLRECNTREQNVWRKCVCQLLIPAPRDAVLSDVDGALWRNLLLSESTVEADKKDLDDDDDDVPSKLTNSPPAAEDGREINFSPIF